MGLEEQRNAWRDQEFREVLKKGGIEDVEKFMEEGKDELENEILPQFEEHLQRRLEREKRREKKIREWRRAKIHQMQMISSGRGEKEEREREIPDPETSDSSDDELSFIPRDPEG